MQFTTDKKDIQDDFRIFNEAINRGEKAWVNLINIKKKIWKILGILSEKVYRNNEAAPEIPAPTSCSTAKEWIECWTEPMLPAIIRSFAGQTSKTDMIYFRSLRRPLDSLTVQTPNLKHSKNWKQKIFFQIIGFKSKSAHRPLRASRSVPTVNMVLFGTFDSRLG